MKRFFLFLLSLLLTGGLLTVPAFAEREIYPPGPSPAYYPFSHDVTSTSFQYITYDTYAVFFSGNSANWTDVGFEHNTGTGLYISGTGTKLSLQTADFISNSKGGIYSGARTLRLNNGQFYANTTTSYGGGIYFTQPTEATIDNTTFTSNQADLGGAIYASQDLTLTGGNISFTNNISTSNKGGAIYANANLTINAQNGPITFTNNTNGGAIYMDNSATTQLTLQPSAQGDIIFNDTLQASSTLNVTVRGLTGGTVFFNRPLPATSLALQAGGIYFNPSFNWTTVSLNLTGGQLLLNDGVTNTLNFGTASINGDISVTPDVDLQNNSMDRFDFASSDGIGNIAIQNFNLLSDNEAPTTVNFMAGAGKNQVTSPDVAYGDLYAYNVSYDTIGGNFTFVKKSAQSANGFNPAVLAQAASAYAALFSFMQSARPLQHQDQTRLLYSGDVTSSFYLTPYLIGGDVSLSNDAKIDTSLKGFHLGWESAPFGNSDAFALTAGARIGYFQNNAKFASKKIDTSALTTAGHLNLYTGGLMLGVTGQAGFVTTKSPWLSDKQNQTALLAQAEAAYNIGFSDYAWFIQPHAMFKHGILTKGDNCSSDTQTLSMDGTFSLTELKTGLKLMRSYNDAWHWYLGGDVVKQTASKEKFSANTAVLPYFQADSFTEISLGFQTTAEEGVSFSGAFILDVGDVKQFGAQVAVYF